ncbi:MAG: TIGR03619 family F420-dependent LLM class oxidoreductase [Alphaproteobacteria bacterium]|nr:TIGR03619 family F420-dependent LLM class oxidoreductase [Alphaproteobacteria bacterium]MCB9927992.1 TIGR03619 family F420-dependent LLM class oxidoreductase [Alphaproteobacteria bacterium]
MKFGLHFGSRGTAGEPDSLKAIARKAEACGFTHFGMSDHVVVATEVDSAYPYSETGKFFAQDSGVSLETITALSFVASATSTIRLLSSVLVLPHRQPVLAAKMLATLDVLSKGRMTVGVGIGWMAEEIALLGGPEFRHRARASEETVEAFRELWTAGQPRYQGEHVRFDHLLFAPKPVQRGGLPVWVGGEAKGALRRAGRLADAWYPVAAHPRFPLDTPTLYGASLDQVRTAAADAGRDPTAVEAALLAIKCRVGPELAGRDGRRMPFTGSAQAIVDDIGAYRAVGLQHFLIGGDGDDLPRTLERMEEFQTEVMAKLG